MQPFERTAAFQKLQFDLVVGRGAHPVDDWGGSNTGPGAVFTAENGVAGEELVGDLEKFGDLGSGLVAGWDGELVDTAAIVLPVQAVQGARFWAGLHQMKG